MPEPASPESKQQLWNASGTPAAPAGSRAASGGGGGNSGWVTGLALFGGVVLLVDGVFAILRGIMGIAKDQVFVATPNYVFKFDLTAWGWIHLLLGVVLVVVGYGILKGSAWGRFAGITLAAISLVLNFLSLPYYPFWSIVALALDLAVVWALCVYQPERSAA